MYTYPHGPESKPSTEQRKFSHVSSKKKSYHSMPIYWIFFFFFAFCRNALPCIPYLIHTLPSHCFFFLLLYVLFVSTVFLRFLLVDEPRISSMACVIY